MNNKRARWIRKLFKEMDVGLILSMGQIYGKDFSKEIHPKRLYRKAKKMWNTNHPSTKTWGKSLPIKFEKTKTEGVENG
jgi:hypothetical protein